MNKIYLHSKKQKQNSAANYKKKNMQVSTLTFIKGYGYVTLSGAVDVNITFSQQSFVLLSEGKNKLQD